MLAFNSDILLVTLMKWPVNKLLHILTQCPLWKIVTSAELQCMRFPIISDPQRLNIGYMLNLSKVKFLHFSKIAILYQLALALANLQCDTICMLCVTPYNFIIVCCLKTTLVLTI